MVWSEQIGASLIVPSDANPDDPTDTRDYIILGEDVPAELASVMQAGLVFHKKNASTGEPQYWALGITVPNGNLEMIAYMQSQMSETPTLLTLFSLGFTPDGEVAIGGGSYPDTATALSAGLVYANNVSLQAPQDSAGNSVARRDFVCHRSAYYFPRSNFTGNAADNYTAGTMVSVMIGSVDGLPAGDWLINFNAVMSTPGGTSAGYLRAMVNNVNVSQDARADTSPNPRMATYSYLLQDFAGGTITAQLYVESGTTTGTFWTNGSYIQLIYLGPRR